MLTSFWSTEYLQLLTKDTIVQLLTRHLIIGEAAFLWVAQILH